MEKVVKQTRIQKLQQKLDDATELEKQKQNDFIQLRREQRGLDRRVEDLYWDCKEAKEQLYKAKKEQKKKDELVKKTKESVRNTQHQALDLKIEYAVMSKTEQEKEEKKAFKKETDALKKKGQKSEPILDRVDLLPEEVVSIIASYLTYDVRIKLLESRGPIKTYLDCLRSWSREYLFILCRQKEFLTLFEDINEALCQVSHLKNHIPNPKYKKSWLHMGGRNQKASVNKILHMINLAKERNPKFAYQILSLFYIKIDPTKRYTIKNYDTWLQEAVPRQLTIHDFPEGTVFP
jgi:hypothetical protein